MVINQETKLPEPTGECLLIPAFLELWTRSYPIDGDRKGLAKKRNLQEFGYIYFHSVYDSRFKNYESVDKERKIKELLGLPKEWKASKEHLDAISIYTDLQITGSVELVDSMNGLNADLAKWVKIKRTEIALGKADPDDVAKIIKINHELPSVITDYNNAKATLLIEQEKKTGRGNRRMNKFEEPPDEV